jgi:hypothetical protein
MRDDRATVPRLLGLTSIGVMLGITAPALAQQPCGTGDTAGLVSLWSGEGNATDTYGDNHGEMQGGVTFVPGVVGSAFSFDGIDDLVRIPDADSLDPGANWTVEAWVKPSDWDTWWDHYLHAFVQKRYAYGLTLHKTNDYDLFIGYDGLRSLFYNGLVDEVAVYDGRMSAETAAAHFAAGLAGEPICVCVEEALAGLVDELEYLNEDVSAGLSTLAAQALTSLEDGNTNAASGLMTGLLHSLQALAGSAIPQDEADALIAIVEDVMDAL